MHVPFLVEQLVVGRMQTNCYLVVDSDTHESIIIDPGDDAEYIISHLNKREASPVAIIATHGHFDHIMAARHLQLIYAIPFYIHKNDIFLVSGMQKSAEHFLKIPIDDLPPTVSKTIEDSESISVGPHKLFVYHTPGHTPGSVTIRFTDGAMLFVGDTIFKGGLVGRTDFSYSNKKDLDRSIFKILSFEKQTRLLAGHGDQTTVGEARKIQRI